MKFEYLKRMQINNKAPTVQREIPRPTQLSWMMEGIVIEAMYKCRANIVT